MKHLLILAVLALALPGCAHTTRKAKVYRAPDMGAVSVPLKSARVAIKESQKKASQLKSHVDTAGLPIWQEMTAQLEEANAKAANAEASLVLVEADVKNLEKAANLESALRAEAEIKAETERKKALANGRERDICIVIFSVGCGLLGSAALMPSLKTLMLPLAATGWGGILILITPFVLPLVLVAGAFWAVRALLSIVRNLVF